MYLGSDLVPILDDEEDAFDLLVWWNFFFETKFPVLYAMAYDILTIAASAIALE